MPEKTTPPGTLLITLTGKDRPGVTSAIFATLATAGVEVLDLEQIVLRRRLILGVLVTAPRDWRKLRDAVAETARALDMHVDVDHGTGDNLARQSGRSHVTIIGTPLTASAMGAVAGRIADTGANIDRIERMARYPVTAIDLHVSGAEPEALRALLAAEAARQGLDIAVQPANLLRRGMRLVVMDVDSTLIQGEVIEMLAAHAGYEAEVAEVTERGDARRARLRGVPARAGRAARGRRRRPPSTRCTTRSCSPPAPARWCAPCAGSATGSRSSRAASARSPTGSRPTSASTSPGPTSSRSSTAGSPAGSSAPVVDRAGKAAALRQFAAEVGVPEAAVVAIGDGANDLDMLNAAGLGIAYNAKPLVRDAADTAVNVPYLDAIMYLLGISREEIEAADAEAGIVTPAPPV